MRCCGPEQHHVLHVPWFSGALERWRRLQHNNRQDPRRNYAAEDWFHTFYTSKSFLVFIISPSQSSKTSHGSLAVSVLAYYVIDAGQSPGSNIYYLGTLSKIPIIMCWWERKRFWCNMYIKLSHVWNPPIRTSVVAMLCEPFTGKIELGSGTFIRYYIILSQVNFVPFDCYNMWR